MPDAPRDCFALMEAHHLKRLRIGAHSDIDAVVRVDDTSTTAISSAMLEACNLNLTDVRADAAHAAGKLHFRYSCSRVRRLLPPFRRTKMDVVHAFTLPLPSDDTIAKARKELGDHITITRPRRHDLVHLWVLRVGRTYAPPLTRFGQTGDGWYYTIPDLPRLLVYESETGSGPIAQALSIAV